MMSLEVNDIGEKVVRFALRLTPEQHAILERGAAERGVSKNQFIVYLLTAYDELGDVEHFMNWTKVEMEVNRSDLEAQRKAILEIAKTTGVSPEVTKIFEEKK